MGDLGASGGTPPYSYQWLFSTGNNIAGPYTIVNASAVCGPETFNSLRCDWYTVNETQPLWRYYFEVGARDSKGLTAVSQPSSILLNPHLVPIPVPTIANSPIFKGQVLVLATDKVPNPLNGTPPYTYRGT